MQYLIPSWLRMEMKVSYYAQRMERYGWLADRDLIVKHINTLDDSIAALEQIIMPQVPMYCVCYEKAIEKNEDGNVTLYHHVTKPFLKSGAYSKSVEIWIEEGGRNEYEVWGPFTRVGFEKINLRSDDQVKRYLLSIGWEPLEWNISKSGKNKGKVTSPKMTEESLETLTNKVGKLIAQHIKCCHRKSQMTGWLECIRPDGRIPSIVNPQAAPTARMTHKNIVNVPSIEKGAFFAREMREVFIAKPGYVLVGCDSDADQIRKLCHYMGDDDFTHAVLHGKKEDGTDMHSLNMAKAGLPTRGHAKNFFYGFIFGAGPAKVGKLIKKGPKEGKAIIDRYYAGLPKLKQLNDALKARWEDRGYLIGLDGRRIYVRSAHELLCYLLQSAEAIMMKLAMCYVNYWIDCENLDAHQVCIMHDEYTFEVKEDHAERVVFLAEEAIRQAGRDLKLKVPSDGHAKIGKNWADIH